MSRTTRKGAGKGRSRRIKESTRVHLFETRTPRQRPRASPTIDEWDLQAESLGIYPPDTYEPLAGE